MDCEIVRIRDSGDIRRAAEDFRDIAMNTAEMRLAACHNIARKGVMMDENGANLAQDVFGWTEPEEQWWKSDRLALESPLTCACRYESEVFWINAEGIRTRHANPFVDKIDLTSFASRAMTHAAIVTPVHLPFGQIAAASFNPIGPDRTDLEADYERYGALFERLARVFLASYVSVSQRKNRVPVDSQLSRREVECVRWASVGKTDEEISMIMYRSRATVRFHLHNASVKLDAVNRSQTVFKAAQLGYISV